jgi:hypothetical protein
MTCPRLLGRYHRGFVIVSSTYGAFIDGIETAVGRKHFVESQEMSFREVRGIIPWAHDTTRTTHHDGCEGGGSEESANSMDKVPAQSFLGLANLYRRLVKDFAKVAHPLTEMTKADLPTQLPEFTPDATAAFSRLKARLTTPSTLMLPRDDAELVLDMDASNE